jgi:integrase
MAERKAAQVEAQKARLVADSLSDLSTRFLASHGPSLAPRTLAEYRRTLAVDILPELGEQPPKEITRAMVRALLDSIRKRAPTATRSEEARSARWSDMDLERKLWVIPDTKEGQAHAVPLSDGAMRLLASLPRVSDYVFPAGTAAGYMDHPQKAVLAVRARGGVTDFRLHDIHRTVRTRLAELGVTPDVAERVLGHVIAGIRRVYDRYDYVPQMRAALDLWGAEFERILGAAA